MTKIKTKDNGKKNKQTDNKNKYTLYSKWNLKWNENILN